MNMKLLSTYGIGSVLLAFLTTNDDQPKLPEMAKTPTATANETVTQPSVSSSPTNAESNQLVRQAEAVATQKIEKDESPVVPMFVPLSQDIRTHFSSLVMRDGRAIGVMFVGHAIPDKLSLNDRRSVYAGDIVLEWNGQPVFDIVHLEAVLRQSQSGISMIKVLRQGQLVQVVLAPNQGFPQQMESMPMNPANASQGSLSISANTINGLQTVFATYTVEGQAKQIVLNGTVAEVANQFNAICNQLPNHVRQAIQSKLK